MLGNSDLQGFGGGLVDRVAGGIDQVIDGGIELFDDASSAVTDTFNDVFGEDTDPENAAQDARAGNLPIGGEVPPPIPKGIKVMVKQDWRVRLSLPKAWKNEDIPILAPLKKTDGLIFPYTPNVFIGNSASYNALKPTHSNYAFYGYQNSQVENISITGDFFIETPVEARYWLGALHYLRAITKMSYGETAEAGSPPPIVKLNGYGDHVFKDVSVLISSFNVDLQQDVDYIKANTIQGSQETYVPTRSTITVTLMPVYSRKKIETFSLDKFVKGEYLGSTEGFI